jgi:putative chitinase
MADPVLLGDPLISAEQLQTATGCSAETATIFIGPINITLERFEINTLPRIAAFLAQVGHESGGLRWVREIWGPTLSQQRYEGRKDLGNTHPGDGKRFMGRGLIQITGRANYAAVSAALGIDAVNNPEVLESPLYASLSAGWFWGSRKLNGFADQGDILAITRRINGGTNGLDDRLARYKLAQTILA